MYNILWYNTTVQKFRIDKMLFKEVLFSHQACIYLILSDFSILMF